MPSVAFLSMDNLDDFFVYDELLIPYFEQAGWQVTSVPWRDSTDWNNFDAVIVRSPWDYQQSPASFLQCLRDIERSTAYLENPLALMEWNLEKTYLKVLQEQEVATLPTLWQCGFDLNAIEQARSRFNTNKLIVKPVLSANADDTFLLTGETAVMQQDTLSDLYQQRQIMIQPFAEAVVEAGEYSVFYCDNRYSHAILKTPKQGDFRVQEEHGGSLQAVTPDHDILAVCEQALAAMPTDSLYARVDIIRFDNHWAIMELELIEPSLYFNLDDASSPRFVEAFLSRYNRRHAGG
ncbi:hypothetical protein OCL06_09045 [Alteromonas sp. ASW11-19]|uniref:Prokaryotic glutathione synthetase ATP-binding domain-containing protein n=1 Tax=Alteromonas salexigens TaxID=2982530 RepID=A0ABT2VS72_9ALTE|nr:hypothetical protein [Alteromonas salexigens]MCU7554744.1 hypothetical protein [Alteromonas salexigens]